MASPDSHLRHDLALKYSVALCFLIALGLLVRLMVAADFPWVLILAALHFCLALILYRMVSAGNYPALEAPLLLALSISTLIPMLLITGGVNSQLTGLLICLPFIAAWLGDGRLPFYVYAAIVVVLLAMLAFNDLMIDISDDPVSARKATARALWVIVGLSVSTAVGSYFQHQYMKLTRRLEQLAHIDHLTGLLNRRGIETRLDEALQRQKRNGSGLAMLVLDIDNFKQFNDTYGHDAGDRCLVALARCLQLNTRGGDLLARFGGEEFLVVLIDIPTEYAPQVADKLRRQCARVGLPGIDESISVTIGVICPGAGSSMTREQLIRCADEALYRGKREGRNRVVVAECTA